MTYYLVMIRANVADAKAHLSEYLDRIEAGEVLVICRRNVPVAELRAVSQPGRPKRRVGVGRELFGNWTVPEAFDEPLPDWMLDAFEAR